MEERGVAAAMHERLTADLALLHLEIIDDSHHHAGHAGHRDEGETHFTVIITAAAFAGLGRASCHRMIYASLAKWMNNPIHALSIRVSAPDDDSE